MAGRGSATRAAASSWTRLRTRPGSPPHRRPALGNPPGGAVRSCSRPSIRGSKTRFGHPSIAPINRAGAGTSPALAARPKVGGSGERPGHPPNQLSVRSVVGRPNDRMRGVDRHAGLRSPPCTEVWRYRRWVRLLGQIGEPQPCVAGQGNCARLGDPHSGEVDASGCDCEGTQEAGAAEVH